MPSQLKAVIDQLSNSYDRSVLAIAISASKLNDVTDLYPLLHSSIKEVIQGMSSMELLTTLDRSQLHNLLQSVSPNVKSKVPNWVDETDYEE